MFRTMSKGAIYRFGPFRVDAREHALTRDGKAITVTPKVFATLVAFLRSPGRLLTKEELLTEVWPDATVEESNLTVNVSTLRRLLGDDDTTLYIETVPRLGYRFVHAVSVEHEPAAATAPVPGAVSIRAQELYARANQIADEADRWETARDLYQACVQDTPDFAPAWARLGRCHRLIAKFSPTRAVREHGWAQASLAFEQALALNPSLSLAHSLYAQFEVDMGLAREAVVRLLVLIDRQGPDAAAFAGLVHALRFCGLLQESRIAHDRARALEPTIATSVAHTCWQLGDFETALAETAGDIGYIAGLALGSLGRHADAIAALKWREQDTRDNRPRAYLVSLRTALEGDRAASLAALLRAMPGVADPEGLYYIARTYAMLGDTVAALRNLRDAVEAGYACYPALAGDAWLEGLRSNPEYHAILETARQGHALAALAFADAEGERILST
jgi:DNA-binding winged helix-turn-helix (wHTH) protein